ncbi:MAG: 2-C-methyl-D-erythritol 2,4-cyclodiphosphate synthase [Treponema sp.]|jgi:2-C-methyl-D-erythritol 2,4-cyclodiphosphate synthase/2-C-methyl-D-erythritol 4-phosphate cytidylyltransferase/2-C-methyl-D-erythritol 2,4-cyclodiphosphate synthase|nr:2-C-methyl-D-erythritol 2,4-cyclodiphosphate synthase [Treponema sp.]
MIRVGLGWDTHRLESGRRFILAGIEFPFEKGMAGHSDGDVLAHAAADALLGAAGLGDIGEFFPPGQSQWKDADSMELLDLVWAKVKKAGWRLVNLDCVVIAEKPPILPMREQIREKLARRLDAEKQAVFVKGKTGEGAGPAGEGLTVEAEAVCLLEKS